MSLSAIELPAPNPSPEMIELVKFDPDVWDGTACDLPPVHDPRRRELFLSFFGMVSNNVQGTHSMKVMNYRYEFTILYIIISFIHVMFLVLPWVLE